MVDVVLIQPPCDDLMWGHSPQTSLPLGLSYLSSTLIEGGFNVKVIDADTLSLNTIDVLDRVIKEHPRVVGLSITTPTLRSAYKIVKGIQERVSAEVVLGGPHITADPNILCYFDVKYGFSGDVVWGFTELCKCLIWGVGDPLKIPSVILNEGGEIKINKGEQLDVEGLPTPARRLFPVGEYRNMPIICSWGCPFQCTFCALSNTEYQNRKVESIVEEIERINTEYPFTSVGFVDNVFTLKRGLVEGICQGLRERKIHTNWSCTTRVDLVDESLLKDMYSAGCRHVSFGVESGVEHIRAHSGKNIPNQKYEEIVGICRQVGIKTRVHCMFGHPNETLEDMKRTLFFMKKLNSDYAVFSAMTIYPNTQLARDLIKTGELKPDAWAKYMLGKNTFPEYTPPNITSRDVHGLILDAIKSFYFRPRYLLHRGLNIKSGYDVKEVVGLCYSIIREGFGFT